MLRSVTLRGRAGAFFDDCCRIACHPKSECRVVSGRSANWTLDWGCQAPFGPDSGRDAGLYQILPHRPGVMRECNFRLIDVRMPALFPFEAVIAFVSVGCEHPYGFLYWNVPHTGEHVM